MSLKPVLSKLISHGACAEVSWPFSIDWTHEEAHGLEELVIATPMGMVDLVSNAIGVRAGSSDSGIVNEFGGVSAYFDGDGDLYNFPDNSDFVGTDDFSIVWESEMYGFVDSTQCISTFFSASGYAARLCYGNGAGADLWMTDGTSFFARMLMPSGVDITSPHYGVWSFTAGVGHRAWVNGKECSVTGTLSPSTQANKRRVGGGSSSAVNDFNGSIRQVRRYIRAWTEEEAISFGFPGAQDRLLIGHKHRPYRSPGGTFAISGSGHSVASGSAQITVSYPLAGVGIALAGGTADITGSVSLIAAGAAFGEGTAAPMVVANLIAYGFSESAGQAYLVVEALLVAFGVAECLGSAALLRRDNRINYLNQKAIRVISNNLFFRC